MNRNFYNNSNQHSFEENFSNPGAILRDAPFWAWNGELSSEELCRQIRIFKEMGMGGFHMHARTGLATEYLGKEFMACFRSCVEEARKNGMLACLYDEDRYPSGAAGGLVTVDKRFRQKRLLVTAEPPQDDDPDRIFLAAYSISLDENGDLKSYRKIDRDAPVEPGILKILLYRILPAPEAWYNNQTPADSMSKETMQRFIELTHERYFQNAPEAFGNTIPSVFSDEPRVCEKKFLLQAKVMQDLTMAYADDFPESYEKYCGENFFDTFPEIIWNRADGICSPARWRYHNHVTDRFANGFLKEVWKWCEKHNIASTGHLYVEGPLEYQTRFDGDLMRCYKYYQLPGIDVLLDNWEPNTAKQAQSISRQFGRGGVLCELDGVTDWDFDFRSHKTHGDWQAALGVTFRVPHLSWYTMHGEAKRDYPGSIHFQSSWYKKYPLLADHFARVNAAMTRGEAVVRTAVIHPAESYFLVFGPADRSAEKKTFLDTEFKNLTDELLADLIDFDFLCEALLPEQIVDCREAKLKVGAMSYDTVIVPGSFTLRSSTLEILEQFAARGGKVIFAGFIPEYCDAIPSLRAKKLAEKCQTIRCRSFELPRALDNVRDVRVLKLEDSTPFRHLVYQLRQENETRYLFLANKLHIGTSTAVNIRLRGSWQLELLDTFSGSITPVAAEIQNDTTTFNYCFHPGNHLLLRLTPAKESCGITLPWKLQSDQENEQNILCRINDGVPFSLNEPNVLMLDCPEWKLNDEASFREPDEILRIDGILRKRFSLPSRSDRSAQTWTQKGKTHPVLGMLSLRYHISCQESFDQLCLAMEEPENVSFKLDGREIKPVFDSFYLDPAIRSAGFPALDAGEHILEITLPFSAAVNLERMYLLGSFGVFLQGRRPLLKALPKKLYWGNVNEQGLPFYGGVITWHCSFLLQQKQDVILHIPHQCGIVPDLEDNLVLDKALVPGAYRGSLLACTLDDGKKSGNLAFLPYELDLGTLEGGTHKLDLHLYNSRYNCAGSVHCAFRIKWCGPNAFRTQGDLFSREYRLVEQGIMVSPVLLKKDN